MVCLAWDLQTPKSQLRNSATLILSRSPNSVLGYRFYFWLIDWLMLFYVLLHFSLVFVIWVCYIHKIRVSIFVSLSCLNLFINLTSLNNLLVLIIWCVNKWNKNCCFQMLKQNMPAGGFPPNYQHGPLRPRFPFAEMR